MTDEIQGLIEDNSFVYDGYRVVRGEFLSRTDMPAICFDGVRLSVNAACLRKMPDVNYVQFLVNPSERKLALRPCGEDDKDSFPWCGAKGDKRKPRKIVCRLFTAKLAALMGWSTDKRYRIIGTLLKTNSEYLLLFDLSAAEAFCRAAKDNENNNAGRLYFPAEWLERFEPTVEEHERSTTINLFDDYTVFKWNG